MVFRFFLLRALGKKGSGRFFLGKGQLRFLRKHRGVCSTVGFLGSPVVQCPSLGIQALLGDGVPNLQTEIRLLGFRHELGGYHCHQGQIVGDPLGVFFRLHKAVVLLHGCLSSVGRFLGQLLHGILHEGVADSVAIVDAIVIGMALHESIQYAVGCHHETGNLRNQTKAPGIFTALQGIDAACLLSFHPSGGHLHGAAGQLGHNAVISCMTMVETFSVVNGQGQGGLEGEHRLGRLGRICQLLHRILGCAKGVQHDFLHLLSKCTALGIQLQPPSFGKGRYFLFYTVQSRIHCRECAPVGQTAAAHAVSNGSQENTLLLHPVQGMIILAGSRRCAALVRLALKRDPEGSNGGILDSFPHFIPGTFLQ